MITINKKNFAKNKKEFLQNDCVGYYTLSKNCISLYTPEKKKVGIINSDNVLGSATETSKGKYWYSYGHPDIVGEYESYSELGNEIRAIVQEYLTPIKEVV